ncbi:MAG: polymer-forming cytoskeletal protein [Thiobacillus sp.]|nr:polymer-forming cytoskeletal protein [Thiobacillus sp.]
MHPGNTSNSRTDSAKTSPSAYASARTTEAPKPAETIKEEAAPVATQPARNDEGSKLIVGPNIKLKGSEITDCEILVVEGRVEASMNSRDIRIAEGGVFSGKAEIDVAEVRGTFEGDLTARKRLVIYATGKVTGVIRYGAMMIEEGGTLAGDVATLAGGPSLAKVPETPTPAPTSAPAEENAAELEQIHSGSTFGRNQRRQG